VTPEEVRRLADATNGRIPARPDVPAVRKRPEEPLQRSARRVEYKDPRAVNASFHRDYVVPSYTTAAPGEAEALDLLAKIAVDGATSRLYKRLVVEEKIASSAGGSYSGSGLDSGTIGVYAIAQPGTDLAKIEASVDEVLAELSANGVTAPELERAKASYIAEYIYENDNQASLARRYGWGLATGRTVAQIESWPEAISKVTLADIKKVAETYIDPRHSVTGYLLPVAAEEPSQRTKKSVTDVPPTQVLR
jgi:zinc protease